uniref:Retrovirus-related Pol polyprotein from transposon RE2 n=1 Tax=Quercus lobata TaxID=97700 RepID=A0A7N2LFG1_QUELO
MASGQNITSKIPIPSSQNSTANRVPPQNTTSTSMNDENSNPSSPYFLPTVEVVLVSQPLIASVIYINTARDLWIDMESRFSPRNAPRLLELKKEIAKFSQGQLSPRSYQGGNHNYHQGGNHGHQGGKRGKKERPICIYCGIVGHVVDKCYKLHGYPPGYKPKGKSSANQVSTNGMFGNSVPYQTSNNCFENFNSQAVSTDILNCSPQYISPQSHFMFESLSDCCASIHINMPQSQFGVPQCLISQSQSEQLLYFLNSYKETSGGNQAAHQAATIMSPLNAASTAISPLNAFGASTTQSNFSGIAFCFNLISVTQLTRVNLCCLIFLDSFCFIQALVHWNTIGLGRESRGLYLLQHSQFVSSACSVLGFSNSVTYVTYSTDFVPSSTLTLTIDSTELDLVPNPIQRPISSIRRSSRPHKTPSYLQDYSCHTVLSKHPLGLPCDISNFLTYSHLNKDYKHFVFAVQATPIEPTSFHQVVQSPDWRTAMDKEIHAIELNNTWILTSFPLGKIPIGWNDPVCIADLKQVLDKNFGLNQRKYALEILQDTGLIDSKPVNTPMEQNLHLPEEEGRTIADSSQYRKLIAAHRVLQYVKGSLGKGLFFPAKSDLQVKAFCDADWAGFPNTRRFLTRFHVFLGKSVSWRSKKQSTVSSSSAEVEYKAMATTTCEIIWILQLLRDLRIDHLESAMLFCDNQATLHIAANPVFHKRIKHIEVDFHLVRDKIAEGEIRTFHVSSRLWVYHPFLDR